MYLRWLFEFIKLKYNIELSILVANGKRETQTFLKFKLSRDKTQDWEA